MAVWQTREALAAASEDLPASELRIASLHMHRQPGSMAMITCAFCGTTVPDTEAAIDAGWIPSFWHAQTEYGGHRQAVCSACTRTHLEYNAEMGDYQLKAGAALPADLETARQGGSSGSCPPTLN